MPSPRYRPLGDSARRYLDTRTGKSISRREYDNRRAKSAGFRNRYQLEQYRENLPRRWADWPQQIREHTGRPPTFQDYADIRRVRQARKELRQRYPNTEGERLDSMDSELVAADGPLARILDRSGRRPMDGRPVGES
jgi:hypothetical protein